MPSCPRCQTALSPAAGALHEDVCGGCGGRFLPGDAARTVLEGDLGITPGMLRELCAMFGGERLPCPACQQRMHPVQLSSVPVDVCLACGGLWCDPGELLRLTGGRRREVVPLDDNRAPAAPAPAPVAAGPVPSFGAISAGDDEALTHLVFALRGDSLDKDALVHAFTQSRRMTAVDARQRAAKSRGILARRLSRDDAADLAQHLGEAGIDSRAIDLRGVPALSLYSVRPASYENGAFLFLDQYNRKQTVPWSRVRAVGANRVNASHTRTRIQDPGPVAGGDPITGFYGAPTSYTPDRIETVRIDTTRFDFILDDPATRLAIVDINHVGRPRQERVAYMAELLEAAQTQSPTLLSRGAQEMVEHRRLPANQPMPAYEEEMLWMQLRLFHS